MLFHLFKDRFLSIGYRLAFRIVLLLLFLSLLIGFFGSAAYKKECIRSYGTRALSIAKTVAALIDGDAYIAALDRGIKDEYWRTNRTFFEKARTDNTAAYVYAVSPADADHYRYFATGNFDVEIGHIQHRFFFSEEIANAFITGSAVHSGVYDAGADEYDSYGKLISGYAPIVDTKGNVVGVVGVDISVDQALVDSRAFRNRILAFILLMSIAVAALCLYQMDTLFTKPLRLITRASMSIAEGDMDIPSLPCERLDEIGLLAGHINRVAGSVNALAARFDTAGAKGKADVPFGDGIGNAHIDTGALSGRYLETAQGINMVLSILDTLDGIVYVVDPETDRFVFLSRKAVDYFQIGAEAARSRPCWESFGHDERCPLCDRDALLKPTEEAVHPCEHEEYFPDRDVWMWVKSYVFRWFDGRKVYLSEARDITEQKKLRQLQLDHESEMERTALAAQEASRMKSTFLATMSHEIRTPMNGIIGFSELAMEDTHLPAATRQHLEMIHKSGRSLLRIINDILDISKIEAGNMELEAIPFRVCDVFMMCEGICRPKAEEKGLLLHFYTEGIGKSTLLGDPTKLRQVLLNLVSNAIKFTSTGMIKIRCLPIRETPDSVSMHFEVADTGIGMTGEQLDKVFHPFTQADSSTTRKYGGTGLGLSIAKDFVELMGGALEAESLPAIGSKFHFTVDFKLSDTPAKTEADMRNELPKKRPLFEGEILLCEDNEINQAMVVEHLHRIGFQVAVASNGLEGVNLVKQRMDGLEEPFRLIFMDIHMPVMDGLEAVRHMRMLGVSQPIIALTANIMATDREHYRREGMDACLGKPFTAAELWQCLESRLEPIAFADMEINPVPPGSQPDGAAVNRTLGLARSAGNATLYEKQLARFVDEKATFISDFDAAMERGDAQTARRMAHSLKGVAAMLGAERLAVAADVVESGFGEGAAPFSGHGRFELEEELSAVLDELRNERRDNSPTTTTNAGVLDKQAAVEALSTLHPLLLSASGDCLETLQDFKEVLAPLGEKWEGLCRQVEDYDFDPAAKTVEDLLQTLAE